MEKEFLREEYKRLIYPEDMQATLESYKLVTDAAFSIIGNQKGKLMNSIEDIDSLYLFQMTVLKNFSVLKLAEALNYTNSINGDEMNGLYDPFALSSIIRTQYEAFCNFNNIYRLSKSLEERKFKYNLWVLSGLRYRQSFQAEGTEIIEKKEDERKQIIELKKAIEQSPIFLNLSEDSKESIKKVIKDKKWQVVVYDDEARLIGWHQMFVNSGVNKLLEGQYTFLSLNTHPSNVSVFQFKDLYSTKNDLTSSLLLIKLSKWIISLLIADYCYYFEDAKATFDKLPIMNQILINSYNLMCRNESYKINSASSILN